MCVSVCEERGRGYTECTESQCVWAVVCMFMHVRMCVLVCARVGQQNGLRLRSGGGADGLNHCSGLV